MRVITVLLLLLCAAALAGCEPTRGGYYDGGYYNRGGYYPGYGGGGYGADEDAYERRRRRIEVNCNANWQNCAAVCNQFADPNQRYVCVANCNNALNQCKNR